MKAIEQLRAIISGTERAVCPACEIPRPDEYDENIKICPDCGHIYFRHRNGTTRNLTADEKVMIRKIDKRLKGIGSKKQKKIVRRMIG